MTLQQRFEAFHEENPHVFVKVQELAAKVRERGRKNFGMKAVFEQLRWYSAFETTDPTYKLNNNYTAFYTRLLFCVDPSLRAFFRTRRSQADALVAPLREAA